MCASHPTYTLHTHLLFVYMWESYEYSTKIVEIVVFVFVYGVQIVQDACNTAEIGVI